MPSSQTIERDNELLKKFSKKLSSECEEFKDKNLEFVETKF